MFDKPFPDDVGNELTDRGDFIETKAKRWNYDKYAHITIFGTGKTETIIKPSTSLILGDGASYTTQPHIGLYSEEGGVRKFKPQLKSCKITNEGGQDYTDSYLYNIEFSFTVFTQDDLNAAEETFFRIGAEIQIDFGWNGPDNYGVNSGTLKANIFNFDFSMNDDGSFDCTVKAMSAASLWSGEDLGSVETVKDVDDEDKQSNFLSALEIACRKAFGIDEDEGPDSVDDLGDNKLRVAFQRCAGSSRGTFAAAELIVEPGYFNDDEEYIFYTTIGTLVRYINDLGDDKGNTYKVRQKSNEDETWKWPVLKEIGSAEPKEFVLPNKLQGSYGNPSDGGNAKNFSKWGDTLDTYSGDDKSPIDKIAVSFPFLTKLYKEMEDNTKSLGGFKQSVKISEYLKRVFARLDVVTGGLITLSAVPMKNNKPLTPETSEPPFDIVILNKKMIKPVPSNGAFVFETLSKRSITKSVSLSSNFDSDYILMATKANIEKGTSNGHYLIDDYDGPYPSAESVNPGGKSEKTPAQQAKDLLKMREEIGDKGASPERLSAYGDAIKGYIQRIAKEGELKNGRYGEIQYTLNLSVTIDGVFGIPFLAPINIDRIPEVFQKVGGKGVVFSVTAINHEFDGKGGWDTSLETVMRIP